MSEKGIWFAFFALATSALLTYRTIWYLRMISRSKIDIKPKEQAKQLYRSAWIYQLLVLSLGAYFGFSLIFHYSIPSLFLCLPFIIVILAIYFWSRLFYIARLGVFVWFILFQLNKEYPQKCRLCLSQLAEVSSSDPEAQRLFQEGVEAELTKDYGRALDCYDMSLVRDPHFSACLIAKLSAHFKLKETQKAKEILRRIFGIVKPTCPFRSPGLGPENLAKLERIPEERKGRG